MAAEARRRFDVERLGGTGHRLLSTLSSTEQAIAEQEVRRGLRQLERTFEAGRGGALEASLVSLEPESGRIRAWVGGRDWQRSEFDRVTQARRQAGSAFKPIVYAAALADGRLRPVGAAARLAGAGAARPHRVAAAQLRRHLPWRRHAGSGAGA